MKTALINLMEAMFRAADRDESRQMPISLLLLIAGSLVLLILQLRSLL